MEEAVTDIEVRYVETDQMGIVHHSNYVVWCELGRTHLIKKLGFTYKELEDAGIISPVTNIDLHYKIPVRYGDKVKLHTWIEKYDGVRVIYGYSIINGEGRRCAEGTSTHVCVDQKSFRPLSIRKHLPAWHEAYEWYKK
ncbi:acyl-CoA thioesterase [Salibacterium qingdaonense]|uniref:Acyl-CoA thioester hydrolase n=1 Tax=Salibacterium qingdaonense TaxID=266892 RepID=A0A1I4K6K2_9BACI|nr:thioesterase family protein [Salibacterium qingdaonense]SFL74404.1 acyl-CoA thioester hydrolase [Salibacterium qingdaonense]